MEQEVSNENGVIVTFHVDIWEESAKTVGLITLLG